MLQRRHARRGLGLSVHDEELAAALRGPFVDLLLNAEIERAASLREHLDRIWRKPRPQARQRGIVKGNAGEMRSAGVSDLRPEARRGDRVVDETNSAARHEVRGDDGKPVGIVQGQMGDADAGLVDGQRPGDLARVGDDRVARKPHIFPAAGRSRGGEKQPQGWIYLNRWTLGVRCDPFDGARARFRPIQGRRGARDSAQFFAKIARPEDEVRLVGFDETFQNVFRRRRIDQRGRVTGRGRGKQTDQCFGIEAAEQKDELLLPGGDPAGKIKAGGADLRAGQPRLAAVVMDRRRRLERRDQRKKSPAGEVQVAHWRR